MEILLRGSSYESSMEILKILFYYISNNIQAQMANKDTVWEDEQFWHSVEYVFESSGLLAQKAPFDLRESDDFTILAFCEKLFTLLVYALTHGDLGPPLFKFCFEALRWVLEAGQDPNIELPDLHELGQLYEPISIAAPSSSVRTVEILLEFGADPNQSDVVWAVLRRKYDDYDYFIEDMDEDLPRQIRQFQANLSDPDAKENQIFEMLLSSIPHGERIVSLDECLLMSLQYGDISVSRKLCHRGANLLFRERAEPREIDGCLGYRTALSVICSYVPVPSSWSQSSPLPVQFVHSMLEELGLDILSDSYMIAGAFISATFAQNHDAIRYLASIGGDINSSSEFGVAALHASACVPSLETCDLLLHLGADPNYCRSGYPSPLHVACYKGNCGVASLLISAGAELENIVSSRFSPWSYWSRRNLGVLGCIEEIVSTRRRIGTPLEILTARDRGGGDSDGTIAATSLGLELLAAGAIPTATTLANTTLYSNPALLEACLRSGGDPNATEGQNSILRLALILNNADCTFMLLCAGAAATWDDLYAAFTLVRKESEEKDGNILLNTLSQMPPRDNDGLASPVSLFWSLAPDRMPSIVPLQFAQFPPDYCSLSMLAAIPACIRTGDLSVIKFLLAQRRLAGRGEPDVFEGAAVVAASISENKELFCLLLLSLAPTRFIAIGRATRTPPASQRYKYRAWPNKTGVGMDLEFLVQSTVADALFLPECLAYSSPLTIPINKGNDSAVMKMLQRGYQPDLSCLLQAIRRRQPWLVKRIISRRPLLEGLDMEDVGPLYVAVEVGDVEILEMLVNEGVTEYETGHKIAMGDALKRGQSSMVDILFSSRLGIHSPAVRGGQRTALQQAVESRNFKVVRQLLEAGVDANQTPAPAFGATALQLAAMGGQMGIARLLIENGADLNAPGSKRGGRTTLEAAAEYGCLDMAQMILELGFDTIGRRGRTAYVMAVAYAKKRGHFVVENMIRCHRPWTYLDEQLEDSLEFVWRDGTFTIDPETQDSFDWDNMGRSAASGDVESSGPDRMDCS